MIKTAVLSMALSFPVLATTISSGDIAVHLSTGNPVYVNPPSPWVKGLTYISFDNTGLGGNNTTNLGLIFSSFEDFSLPEDSTFNFVGAADDRAEFYIVGANNTIDLGQAGFVVPLEAYVFLPAGNYTLRGDVYNDHLWNVGDGNYTGEGYTGSTIPEPSTGFIALFGIVLTFIGKFKYARKSV